MAVTDTKFRKEKQRSRSVNFLMQSNTPLKTIIVVNALLYKLYLSNLAARRQTYLRLSNIYDRTSVKLLQSHKNNAKMTSTNIIPVSLWLTLNKFRTF